MNSFNKNNIIDSIYNCNHITDSDYMKYNISDGLRRIDGGGIVVGLTTLSDVYGSSHGESCSGKIFYRGIDIEDIINSLAKDRFGYEEVVYLLLFGELPNCKQLESFYDVLQSFYEKNNGYMEEVISRNTGVNIMNILASCVLDMYNWDNSPDDITISNLLRQSLRIITMLPVISANIYRKKNSQQTKPFIEAKKRTVAENILYILRGGDDYSDLEAKILDCCLVLHAELGGGNNSCFTTQVVSSTGTDTYSAIASAICSLKGPKHGGANIKTFKMIEDIGSHVSDWNDDEEISSYLTKIIRKEAFDHSGLIYGIGHAVFTISDPRAEILKGMAKELAESKQQMKRFRLYDKIEHLAPGLIQQEKSIERKYCANVDFYSGFIYDMLGIPTELFTPMFVNGRSTGWCAHRIEEICNQHRIVHPSIPCVQKKRKYVKLEER